VWCRLRRNSGLADYRFHDNRHTAASGVLRNGGNLAAVQKLLRHRDIAMVDALCSRPGR
jgi:integrase